MDAKQSLDTNDRPSSPYLDEVGLAALNAAAAKGMEAFNAYLDDAVGVSDHRRWLVEASGQKNAPLEYGSLSFLTLNSQDPHKLLEYMRDTGKLTIDRLIASLRMLQIPSGLLPPTCQPAQHVEMCEEAQRLLSNILVDNPVLLHPRIFISGHPVGSIHWGPICHAMGHTETVEMPRRRHGIDEARLRAFAKSPFLKAGLQNIAPKSLETRFKKLKNMAFQGKTALQVVAVNKNVKAPFILSVLELDELRRPKNGKTAASLLKSCETTESALVSHCYKGILLEAGFGSGNAELWRERFDGFTAALTRHGVIDAGLLTANLGQYVHSWSGVPDSRKADALRKFVHLLADARPTDLRTAEQEVMGQPCTAREIAEWVMKTLLRPSISNLSKLRVDAHAAAIFLTTMGEFFAAEAKDGSLYDRVENLLGADIDENWRAALLEKRMHLQINDAIDSIPMADLRPVHRSARLF